MTTAALLLDPTGSAAEGGGPTLLRIATAGDYEQALPKLNLAQRQVPVVVKLPDDAREDLTTLEKMTVPGARGPVPLPVSPAWRPA